MTPSKRLSEIRARLEKATPGPWGIGWCSEVNERCEIVTQFKGKHKEPTAFVIGEIDERKNQGLIANAPSDLSYLLELVERQGKALDLIAKQRTSGEPDEEDISEGGCEYCVYSEAWDSLITSIRAEISKILGDE